MAWDGSGSFSLVNDFSADRDLGRPTSLIDADKFDLELANFKAGLENCLTLTGETVPVANLSMGGFKLTNVGSATDASDAITLGQIGSGRFDYIVTIGGSANALTGSLTFTPTLQAGLRIRAFAVSDNTGAATFSLNGSAVKDIKRTDGSALKAKDLRTGVPFSLVYNGTYFILESPLTTDGRATGAFVLSSVSTTGSAITATGPATFQAIASGQIFAWTADANSGASPTLAVSGGTAYPVVSGSGLALGANIIQSGGTYLSYFDGSSHKIIGGLDEEVISATSLDEIADVFVPSPSDKDVLTWSTANARWEGVNPLTALLDVDGAGSGLDADLLDGVQGSSYLLAASYTAADVLTKLLTVDGPGTGLDADTVDGVQAASFLLAASYTAADVLTKLLTVDGAGTGLDADLLDGQQGSAYLLASAYTASDVRTKLLTVDGPGSGIDADLLDGINGASFLQTANLLSSILSIDGSGSGIDADLIDGVHLSALAQLSGATFSGNVTVLGVAEVQNSLQIDSLRIDQTATSISAGGATTMKGGTDISHRFSISLNGTTYWVPCTTTAF